MDIKDIEPEDIPAFADVGLWMATIVFFHMIDSLDADEKENLFASWKDRAKAQNLNPKSIDRVMGLFEDMKGRK